MSLVKIVLLISTAFGYHISSTPPNPPSQPDETISEGKAIGSISFRNIRLISISSDIAVWLACFGEAVAIICCQFPSSVISKRILPILVVSESSDSSRLQAIKRIHINYVFLAGWSTAMLGTWIRVSCFRSLGKLFTFELTILPGHRLVTSGPYSVVRHPSYTGAFLVATGVILCVLSPGLWIQECGVLDNTIGRVLLFMWAVLIATSFISFVLRTRTEDSFLKEKFGKEWEEWSASVPYKLIPGLY